MREIKQKRKGIFPSKGLFITQVIDVAMAVQHLYGWNDWRD